MIRRSLLEIVVSGILQLRQLMARPQVRRYVQPLVVVGSIAYLILLLGIGVQQIEQLPWTLYLQAALLGLALYPISLAAQAVGWAVAWRAVSGDGHSDAWSDVRIFLGSHLLKRLPGGIWQIAGRALAYRESGVKAKLPLLASAVELLLFVGVAGIVYVILSLSPIDDPLIQLSTAVAATGIVGYAVGWSWSRSALGLGESQEGARANRARLSAAYLIVAELYLLALVVGGVILMLFLDASDGAPILAIDVVGLWALVAGIGTLASLLPAGFGLREVTLAFVLSNVTGPSAAVVIAVLFRFLFIAGDVIWGTLFLFVAGRARSAVSVREIDKSN